MASNKPLAYYNEKDPFAAAWLRNLIGAGHIAPGDVDERSIEDVVSLELAKYAQCHFFAGIGGWSYALRLAGWSDDRPIWTGSCPCQPFSAAGKQAGFDDARHLWPVWFGLIQQRRPATLFGEQVAAAISQGWLDAVFSDLEGEGYACGAAVLPACSVGAPHIRQRLWFVADTDGRDASAERLQRGGEYGQQPQDGGAVPYSKDEFERRMRKWWYSPDFTGLPDHSVGDTGRQGLQERERDGRVQQETMEPHARQTTLSGGNAGGVVNPASEQMGLPGRTWEPRGSAWSTVDWLPCTDGKARPVEPGTFPLAHGIPGRVGRLRAYGNAIVPQVAAEFIAAAKDALGG